MRIDKAVSRWTILGALLFASAAAFAAPQGENSLRDSLRRILEERFHCHIVISTRLMT